MNAEKVQQVIEIYRKKFEELGIGKKDYPHEKPLDAPEHGLEHCHAMLDKMQGFLKENQMDKAFRWLGFLQSFLWSQKIYTLTDFNNHNHRDFEQKPLYQKPPIRWFLYCDKY